MARIVLPEADAVLDQAFPVLDKGFVRLVDYLGGDARIVQAARVSYGEGTKTYREDKGLIDYLLRNQHTSPFEQVSLTFHCKMPLFVARQWVRHRTAKVNEISGRYSVMQQEFYLPDLEAISFQSEDNKQGRSDVQLPLELQTRIAAILQDGQKQAYEQYEELIRLGVARELARIGLPLSLYTQWYWTIDLHNLLHFLELRLDPHAQLEICAYAEAIYKLAQKVAPMACQSFEEHILGGVRFSKKEINAVKTLVETHQEGVESIKDLFEKKAYQRLMTKLNEGRQT